MGPFIKDCHFQYGKNACCYPKPTFYDCITHLQPAIRDFPNKCPYTDGTPFIPDQSEPSDSINRDTLKYNLVNIETKLITSLDVTLYGTGKELDKHFVMEIGKRYSITYITEAGFKVATGVLREISNNIPDTCTRYIGEYRAPAINAYLGMDCSKEGESDKRLIYICSIRDIEELADGQEPSNFESLSDSEKLAAIYEAIKNGTLVVNCENCPCATPSNPDTTPTDPSEETPTDPEASGDTEGKPSTDQESTDSNPTE